MDKKEFEDRFIALREIAFASDRLVSAWENGENIKGLIALIKARLSVYQKLYNRRTDHV